MFSDLIPVPAGAVVLIILLFYSEECVLKCLELVHAAAAHLSLESLLVKRPRREEGAGEETDGQRQEENKQWRQSKQVCC